MTKNEFAAACGELLIDPGVALENEEIVAALRAGDADEVKRLLREEF